MGSNYYSPIILGVKSHVPNEIRVFFIALTPSPHPPNISEVCFQRNVIFYFYIC